MRNLRAFPVCGAVTASEATQYFDPSEVVAIGGVMERPDATGRVRQVFLRGGSGFAVALGPELDRLMAERCEPNAPMPWHTRGEKIDPANFATGGCQPVPTPWGSV